MHATKFGHSDAHAEVAGFDQGFKAFLDTLAPCKQLTPTRFAIIGANGTRLDWEKPLPEALDYEGDDPAKDEEGDFHPLSVLTSDAWRELGLQGATRWQYL